jgi:hypothetical protein
MATDTPHDPTLARPGSSERTPPGSNSYTPASKATSLIRQLLSGYPSLKDIHDPTGYFANLVSILMKYDERDAEAGVQDVANNGGEFPPSRFTLRKSCEAAATHRFKLERLRSTPAPQARIATEKPADPPPGPDGRHSPGTILSDYGASVAVYGRPIGRFEPGREKL